MEGSDGGRASWSYREQTKSSSYTISSYAGTVSTGFTSTASRLSWTSMEVARHLEEMEKEDPDDVVQPAKMLCTEMKMSSEERPSKMEHMKSLAKEFFGAKSSIGGGDMSVEEMEKEDPDDVVQPAKKLCTEMKMSSEERPSKMEHMKSLAKEFFGAKSSIGGGDMSVLERWFTELGVGWIFHLPVADGAPEAKLEHTLDASRWMLALTEIVQNLWWRTYCGDITEEFQFASFTLQAMLKMLGFIDVIVARNHNVICDSSMSMVDPYRKLHILLCVRDTLSMASMIRFSSYKPPSAEVGRIHGEMISVLSVKKGKVGEAIWSAMEENRNRILESVDNSSRGHCVHEATVSLMQYVKFLEQNFSSVDPIVSEAASLGKYLPQIGDVPVSHLSLLVEMTSCVQEKLANMSEKFPDQSLGFLFLINNLSFIGDQLQFTLHFPESYKESLAGKVEAYMVSYMQVSWAPVLSCLFNPTPLCFGKTYSPLSKFESKFHKTYTTQKLWKVPDPELRKTLREAITEKIVPGYTKYIEDNSVATPKFTPHNLQEMLQELFEG